MRRTWPRHILKTAGLVLGVFTAALAGYVIYLFASYSRIPDMQPLTPQGDGGGQLAAGETLRAVTWNLGFAAYTQDYSFFMDGGTESWARSEASVRQNMEDMIGVLREEDADLMLLQEVDVDGTRSHHVDESALLTEAFSSYASLFAENYDSAFLFYPFYQPHGKNKAGLLTLSQGAIDQGLRVSLPIEEGVGKLVDLDRCYSLARIPVDNGRELCLYNVHLSAYSQDAAVVEAQLEKLYASLEEEYAAGNYILCGGDFNKDLTGRSCEIFGVEPLEDPWALPFPAETLPQGIRLPIAQGEGLAPTCRNADAPYEEGVSFVTYVDGFLLSDNVRLEGLRVEQTGFLYSDHNPVILDFVLEP